MIESLELRRLLTAVLQSNGILTITEGAGDQAVVLTVQNHKDFQPSGGFQQIPYVQVTTNGTIEGEFSTLKVKRIIATLGDGNDSYTCPSDFQFAQYVRGGNGNDTLQGGRNRDALDGDSGNDSLDGRRGNDILGSAAGSDTIIGGLGLDTVDYHRRTAALHLSMDGVSNDGASGETGNLGNDVESVLGGSGSDRIDCSGFATTKNILTGVVSGLTINGNNGRNTLFGSAGNDLIVGGAHNDKLHGGAGDDTLQGHRGNDEFFGEAGADLILSGDDGLRDTVFGIDRNDDVSQVDYTDVLKVASISGVVYNDANGNGMMDAGETGLAGRAVYIDDNNNGMPDNNEQVTLTGASGSYSFGFLAAGIYTIRTVLPAGWTQTDPPSGLPHVVILLEGQVLTGQNFGELT
jgi:Ca2+-binding RTX toxin-like protein